MAALPEIHMDERIRSRLSRSRFYVMIGSVVLITSILVLIAMGLYNSSGAAQLDLSGPGYKDVQKKIRDEKDPVSFPADGTLDKAAFDTFKKMYAERQNAIKAINGYDPAAVNNDSINLVPTEPPAGN